MSTATLRRRAKAMIDALSEPQLRVASEFLAFVQCRRGNGVVTDPATLDLLAIPGLESSYVRGLRDVKAGRTTPWHQVKHNALRRPGRAGARAALSS